MFTMTNFNGMLNLYFVMPVVGAERIVRGLAGPGGGQGACLLGGPRPRPRLAPFQPLPVPFPALAQTLPAWPSIRPCFGLVRLCSKLQTLNSP